MTKACSPSSFFSEESMCISDGSAKKVAVVALVFQNTALVLLLKLSRQRDAEGVKLGAVSCAIKLLNPLMFSDCALRLPQLGLCMWQRPRSLCKRSSS